MRAATPQIARSIFTNDTVNFLGPKGQYIERDFEDAILRELEMFLLELGAGFSFIARQKRIQIHGEDFYIDLLFYNRKLKRLVAVELKQGSFRAEYKGYGEPDVLKCAA
jgi:predicted nuclease of restriction endonuclease-like (RecB) superfamily